MRVLRVLVTGLVLALAFGYAFSQEELELGRGYLKIKGSGEVRKAPEIMKIKIIIESPNKDAEKAYQKALEKNGLAELRLKEIGIKPEKIKVDLQVNMRGVTTTILATTENLIEASKILKLATELEPNDVEVNYELKDREAAEREVLAKASEDCRTRAEMAAGKNGSVLGSLIFLDESPEFQSFDVSAAMIDQLLAVQIGFVTKSKKRPGEVAYQVDGVTVSNPLGGLGAVRGGYGAEYGQQAARLGPVITFQPDEIVLKKYVMAVYEVKPKK